MEPAVMITYLCSVSTVIFVRHLFKNICYSLLQHEVIFLLPIWVTRAMVVKAASSCKKTQNYEYPVSVSTCEK